MTRHFSLIKVNCTAYKDRVKDIFSDILMLTIMVHLTHSYLIFRNLKYIILHRNTDIKF